MNPFLFALIAFLTLFTETLGQVYEVEVVHLYGKDPKVPGLEIRRLFAVIPDDANPDQVTVYGIASRTYSYTVYAHGNPKTEQQTEYYIDGTCQHYVTNGQLVLPQIPHKGIEYAETYHQHTTTCPVSLFFYGQTAWYDSPTRIQRSDLIAMPLQFSGRFNVDDKQVCKSVVRQLPWGKRFLEITEQLGKAVHRTGVFEIMGLDMGSSEIDLRKKLDSISPKNATPFGALYDSLYQVSRSLRGRLTARYDAEEAFTEREDDPPLNQHSTVTSNAALRRMLELSHRPKFHNAVLDAHNFNELVGNNVVFNSSIGRIQGFISLVDRDLSAYKQALAALISLQENAKAVRLALDSMTRDIISKRCLFPNSNASMATPTCVVRSPMLVLHEQLQSGKGSTVAQDIKISSRFSMKGLPLAKGCSPSDLVSYDTTISAATAEMYRTALKQTITTLWDGAVVLSKQNVNPLASAAFDSLVQRYARLDPAKQTNVPGIEARMIEVVSFDVFGVSEQQLQPYYQQIQELIKKIVSGSRTKKYESVEEYVQATRAARPLDAEKLFGDDNKVAERAIGSLFMLYLGALEDQKEAIVDILDEANADEHLSDLFDISEGSIDDVFDDVIESKQISQIGVNRRSMQQYVLESGTNRAIMVEFLDECDARIQTAISRYGELIRYATILRDGYTQVHAQAKNLSGILNAARHEPALVQHTNVPRIESDNLCETLQEYNLSRGTASRWSRQSAALLNTVVDYLNETEEAVKAPDGEFGPEFIGYNPTAECWQFSWRTDGDGFADCADVTNSVITGFTAGPNACTRRLVLIDAIYERTSEDTGEGEAEEDEHTGD